MYNATGIMKSHMTVLQEMGHDEYDISEFHTTLNIDLYPHQKTSIKKMIALEKSISQPITALKRYSNLNSQDIVRLTYSRSAKIGRAHV